jgi:sulfur carrier protein
MIKLRVNGLAQEYDKPLGLLQYLQELGVNFDAIAVAINNAVLRKDDWPSTILKDGDSVEIVHQVGGGMS